MNQLDLSDNPAMSLTSLDKESDAARQFEILFDLHHAYVYAICRAMLGNQSDAQDANQDVFVKLFRNLNRIDPKKDPKAWIRRVSIHTCYDVLRRRRLTVPLTDEPVCQSQSSHEILHKRAQLDLFLSLLSPRERAAVVLVYRQGHSLKETAAAMGCSVGTIKALCYRARNKMRKELR